MTTPGHGPLTPQACRLELGFDLALEQCEALKEFDVRSRDDLNAVVYLMRGPGPTDLYVGSTRDIRYRSRMQALTRFYNHRNTVNKKKSSSPLHLRMLETGLAAWTIEHLEECPGHLRFAYELKWVIKLDTMNNGLNRKLPYNAVICRDDITQHRYYETNAMFCLACSKPVKRLSLCVHERSKKHKVSAANYDARCRSGDSGVEHLEPRARHFVRDEASDRLDGVVQKLAVLDKWSTTYEDWKAAKRAEMHRIDQLGLSTTETESKTVVEPRLEIVPAVCPDLQVGC